MQIVRQGWRFAAVAFGLAALGFLLSVGLAFVLALCGVGILAFFRDPERSPPPRGLIAPADGKVSVIREEDEQVRIGVYMNAFNVHVNRSPVSGRITGVDHRPGAHRPAFSKESDRNERVRIDIAGDDGEYAIELIAGAFARRVTPYVEAGTRIERGERIGHIAFGSRADVLLPEAYTLEAVEVTNGERVRAGESVMVASGATDDSTGGVDL